MTCEEGVELLGGGECWCYCWESVFEICGACAWEVRVFGVEFGVQGGLLCLCMVWISGRLSEVGKGFLLGWGRVRR